MTHSPVQIYLTLRDGLAAIDWYTKTWGATQEMLQMADDKKRVLHATLAIFGGHVMLSDEFSEFETYVRAPVSKDVTTVTVHINLANQRAVAAAFKSAKDAGAKITMPAAKMPWGSYYGRLVDPFGHSWSFAAET